MKLVYCPHHHLCFGSLVETAHGVLQSLFFRTISQHGSSECQYNMPVTFGSIGDIISVSILIKSLVKCLDESRGSSAEYQAVIRELGSLDDALLQVALLLPSCERSEELGDLCNSVIRCAEQCCKCVEGFREKTKKYQRALQRGGSRRLIRDTAAKIGWHVSVKPDLTKFRAEITAQTSSLNMLLATAGV